MSSFYRRQDKDQLGILPSSDPSSWKSHEKCSVQPNVILWDMVETQFGGPKPPLSQHLKVSITGNLWNNPQVSDTLATMLGQRFQGTDILAVGFGYSLEYYSLFLLQISGGRDSRTHAICDLGCRVGVSFGWNRSSSWLIIYIHNMFYQSKARIYPKIQILPSNYNKFGITIGIGVGFGIIEESVVWLPDFTALSVIQVGR